jgi:hypothetical protein
MTLSRLSKDRAEAYAHYTTDTEDAVNTAAYMAREETPKKKQVSEFSCHGRPRATCPKPPLQAGRRDRQRPALSSWMPSPSTDRPAIISTAARAGRFGVARERIACFDTFRIPHDLHTGHELDITRRAASYLQADALAFYLGREFGPVLLQRILRRFLVRETGFLVAPENDCALPGRLAARPDLERGRAAGASPGV